MNDYMTEEEMNRRIQVLRRQRREFWCEFALVVLAGIAVLGMAAVAMFAL